MALVQVSELLFHLPRTMVDPSMSAMKFTTAGGQRWWDDRMPRAGSGLWLGGLSWSVWGPWGSLGIPRDLRDLRT